MTNQLNIQHPLDDIMPKAFQISGDTIGKAAWDRFQAHLAAHMKSTATLERKRHYAAWGPQATVKTNVPSAALYATSIDQERDAQVLALIRQLGEATKGDIANRIGKGHEMARLSLVRLVRNGAIHVVKLAAGDVYTIKPVEAFNEFLAMRQELGLTQQQMFKASGVSTRTIGAAERGECSEDTAKRLRAAYRKIKQMGVRE